MAAVDAVVVVSFGAPEQRGDVLPFLENVLRGRNVPRDRLLEVAGHYYHFGGRSPLAAANRRLVAALRAELAQAGPDLPVYLGNRNWHPFLADTFRAMAADGVRRALAFVTSAFGSYSGCRQYLEDIARARLDAGPDAPEVEKLRLFYNHPEFIAIMAERVDEGLRELPGARLVFTAHSIPTAMAAVSPYAAQLEEACGLIAAAAGVPEWRLAYQSRSGPPQQPWLEPGIEDTLTALRCEGAGAVLLVPVGFLADHMEVVYDLDVEARAHAGVLGLRLARVSTAGDHPRFPSLIRELVLERLDPAHPRRALGASAPSPDLCPADCCRLPARP